MKALFERDVALVIRRPYFAAAAMLGLLTLLLVVSLGWPGGGLESPEGVSERAFSVWRWSCLSALGMVLLMTPALGASAFSEERSTGMLALIVLSGQRAPALIASKLSARLVLVGLALLLPMPLLVAVLRFAGSGVVDLAQVALVLATAALFFLTLSLWLGVLVEVETRALFATWSVVLLVLLGPLVSPELVHGPWVSAVLLVEQILEPPLEPGHSMALDLAVHCLAYGACAVAFTALAALSLAAKISRAAPRSRAARPPRFVSLRRRLSNNPIYWREVGAPARPLGAASLLVVTALALVSALAFSDSPRMASLGANKVLLEAASSLPGSGLPELKIHGAIAAILLALACLDCRARAVVSVVRERADDQLDLLAITPLGYRRFLVGKSLAVLECASLELLAAPVYLCLMGAVVGSDLHIAGLMLLGAMPFAACLSVMQGLLCGLAAATLSRAMSFALLAFVFEFIAAFCCFRGLSPVFLGYRSVLVLDGLSEVGFFVLDLVMSLGVEAVLLLFLARLSKARFDALLGRLGAMEFSVEVS